jgi:hypothetical protein
MVPYDALVWYLRAHNCLATIYPDDLFQKFVLNPNLRNLTVLSQDRWVQLRLVLLLLVPVVPVDNLLLLHIQSVGHFLRELLLFYRHHLSLSLDILKRRQDLLLLIYLLLHRQLE